MSTTIEGNRYTEGDMDNAREGVLYLFAHASRDSYVLSTLDSALAFAVPAYAFHGEQVSLASDPAAGALFAHAPAKTAVIGGMEVSTGKIEKGIVKFLLEGLRWSLGLLETWRKTAPHDLGLAERIMVYAESGLLGDLKSLLVKVAKAVAKATIPLFKSTYEFYEALKTSISNARARYNIRAAGKGVSLNEGLPELAVGGVLSGLNDGMWTKMFESLVSAGLWIMDVISLAAGNVMAVSQSIFGVMSSAVQEMARLSIKLYETYVTDQFIKEAKAHHANVASPSSIHRDPEAFDAWYGAAVQRVPAIAAATIRSGICGDKMRFLRMIDSKGSPMSQSGYKKAFAYLEAIGKQAGNVLRQGGVTIRSKDPVIHALLNPSRHTFNEDRDPHLATRLAIKKSSPATPSPVAKKNKPSLLRAAAQGRLGAALKER